MINFPSRDGTGAELAESLARRVGTTFNRQSALATGTIEMRRYRREYRASGCERDAGPHPDLRLPFADKPHTSSGESTRRKGNNLAQKRHLGPSEPPDCQAKSQETRVEHMASMKNGLSGLLACKKCGDSYCFRESRPHPGSCLAITPVSILHPNLPKSLRHKQCT